MNQGNLVHLAITLRSLKPRKENQLLMFVWTEAVRWMGSNSSRRSRLVGVVKNLRSEDLLALTTLDDSAQVVVPLQKVSDKHQLINVIEKISIGGARISEEVGMARDELDKADSEYQKDVAAFGRVGKPRCHDPVALFHVVADLNRRKSEPHVWDL